MKMKTLIRLIQWMDRVAGILADIELVYKFEIRLTSDWDVV